MARLSFLLYCLTLVSVVQGQYTLHKSAIQNICDCFSLTQDQPREAGSVWRNRPLDLTQSFDYHFGVFLGCHSDNDGSDGIAFVLQQDTNSIGANGDGMGFEGITPSLGITIDTHQNPNDQDPDYDHVAIQVNGDIKHGDSTNLAGPVQALVNAPSIRDCAWHTLEVRWDAPSMTLSAFIDGAPRLTLTRDIVTDLFAGNAIVYWGFTGGTGSGHNLQSFCASPEAAFSSLAGQAACTGDPVIFRDSSSADGAILGWSWNFGDGSGSRLQNPPPHRYDSAGTYMVTQVVTSDDGCSSDSNKVPLVIGSYPVADFGVAVACSGRPLPLVNQTTDSVGPISHWNWTFSGQSFSDSMPVIIPSDTGVQTLNLSVVSAEGCAASFARTLTVSPTPRVTFLPDSGCVGASLTLSGILLDAPVRQWFWLLDNNSLDSSQSISTVFNREGSYLFRLWALSPQGCPSDTVSQVDSIQASHANAGDDTAAALGYPIQLNGSGGAYYQWSPPEGLSNPDIADPVASVAQDTRYTLTAYSPAGCSSTASILLKVYRGPAIYVPSAFTPNGDGVNDVLKITAPGIRTLIYFRIFDRWGKEVFQTSDVNAAWDGMMAGQPMSPGAYVWMFQAIDLTGKTLSGRGTIMLMR